MIQNIPEEAQISELLDKDVKPAMLKLLKELKEDMDKDRKDHMNKVRRTIKR